MLLHLYDHMHDMFSSKVDSHPRAKIKTKKGIIKTTIMMSKKAETILKLELVL